MKRSKWIGFLIIVIFNNSYAETFKNNYANFSLCLQYDNEWYYSGNLHIPVSLNLNTEEESIDEALFADELNMHLLESEENYKRIPDSLNGKIISTDIACNLYEPFAALSNAKDRAQYYFSTRIPASWFMNYLYYKNLAEIITLNKEKNKGNPHIIFLAGGDGSGKTSAVRRLNLPIIENSDIIKDATMSSDFEQHRKMIEKTLELGFKVTIIYVFRPIELALQSNIIRAAEIGRMRPLPEIANAHYKAQKNVVELKIFFGDRVDLIVIDNSKTFEEMSMVEEGIEFLNDSSVKYESSNIVFERALNSYKNIDKDRIPEFVINLVEYKLNASENYRSDSEKQFWSEYLQGLVMNIFQKIGLKS